MDPSNIKGFDQLWVWVVIIMITLIVWGIKSLIKHMMKNSDKMLNRTLETCDTLTDTNSNLVNLMTNRMDKQDDKMDKQDIKLDKIYDEVKRRN